jgi:hypothetical protein
MIPLGELKTTVMELGIESILLRKDKRLKKIVMPLRVAVSLSILFFLTQCKHVNVFVYPRFYSSM